MSDHGWCWGCPDCTAPCSCAHPAEDHYRDREDGGCRACNRERHTGSQPVSDPWAEL